MTYRVKTISRLTGIHRSTILAWERRHGVVRPIRSENGYRLYSQADLERLLHIKHLVDLGHPISEALRMPGQTHIEGAHQQVLQHLSDFESQAGARLLDGLSPVTPFLVVNRVFMPLLKELGEQLVKQLLNQQLEALVLELLPL